MSARGHKGRHTTARERGRRRGAGGGAARKGLLSPRLDPFTPRQHTSTQASEKGIRQHFGVVKLKGVSPALSFGGSVQQPPPSRCILTVEEVTHSLARKNRAVLDGLPPRQLDARQSQGIHSCHLRQTQHVGMHRGLPQGLQTSPRVPPNKARGRVEGPLTKSSPRPAVAICASQPAKGSRQQGKTPAQPPDPHKTLNARPVSHAETLQGGRAVAQTTRLTQLKWGASEWGAGRTFMCARGLAAQHRSPGKTKPSGQGRARGRQGAGKGPGEGGGGGGDDATR